MAASRKTTIPVLLLLGTHQGDDDTKVYIWFTKVMNRAGAEHAKAVFCDAQGATSFGSLNTRGMWDQIQYLPKLSQHWTSSGNAMKQREKRVEVVKNLWIEKSKRHQLQKAEEELKAKQDKASEQKRKDRAATLAKEAKAAELKKRISNGHRRKVEGEDREVQNKESVKHGKVEVIDGKERLYQRWLYGAIQRVENDKLWQDLRSVLKDKGRIVPIEVLQRAHAEVGVLKKVNKKITSKRSHAWMEWKKKRAKEVEDEKANALESVPVQENVTMMFSDLNEQSIFGPSGPWEPLSIKEYL